ncbi:MAG: hypothetical protein Q7K29_01100 [Thermoleophilia bacterium]|nr:hypothetical protein [Thermoleophilia bacterium]
MNKTISKKHGITILAAAMICATVFFVYLFFLVPARNSASAAIDNAEIVIQRASLTCDPKSDQAIALGNSQASLKGARVKFESGSLLDWNAYIEARNEAEKADDAAQTMVDEMKAVFDRALAALAQLDFDPAFAFYKQYPRTEEAEAALASAEFAINTRNDILSAGRAGLDLISVQKVSAFNTGYPKPEKPASVIEGTGNLLVDMAFRNITQLEYFVNHNKSSLEKISSTHERQKLRYMPEEIIASTAAVIGLMPNLYMPAEMQQLYTAMAEANQAAEEFDAFLSTTPNLDDSQIADLTTRLNELQLKLDEASSLLSTINAKYYRGSEASQAGYAAGARAAEKANGDN